MEVLQQQQGSQLKQLQQALESRETLLQERQRDYGKMHMQLGVAKTDLEKAQGVTKDLKKENSFTSKKNYLQRNMAKSDYLEKNL